MVNISTLTGVIIKVVGVWMQLPSILRIFSLTKAIKYIFVAKLSRVDIQE